MSLLSFTQLYLPMNDSNILGVLANIYLPCRQSVRPVFIYYYNILIFSSIYILRKAIFVWENLSKFISTSKKIGLLGTDCLVQPFCRVAHFQASSMNTTFKVYNRLSLEIKKKEKIITIVISSCMFLQSDQAIEVFQGK